MDLLLDASLFASGIRLSTPLILAALGGLYCEKSGVTNIGLDGIMIFGAFSGAVVAFETQDPWWGLLAAIVTGAFISFLHGIASIRYNGDQIISATAINILAVGLPALLSNAIYDSTSVTPNIPNLLPSIKFDFLDNYPILGELFNNYSYLVVGSFLLIPISWYVINKTIFGLKLKACGENPEAAEAAGVDVRLYRMYGVLLSGVLAGLGGAFLSIAHGSAYVRNISSGRGFLALAALIFGKYSPVGVLYACLLFGFADALQIRMQNAFAIPVQVIQIFPFLLAMVILSSFVGRSPVPTAVGKPYVKS
ncbi:MAG: ABC transporter permease [SAR324 cluster bacterium]|nr:ABC transporter permease [SAR324 cluster bacterium]